MKGYKEVKNSAGIRRNDELGVLELRGDDALDFLDRSVTNELDGMDNEGRRALYLTPEGRTRADLHVLDAGNRLLVVTARANEMKETWEKNIFIEDVEVAKTEYEVVELRGSDSADVLDSLTDELPNEPHDFAVIEFGAEEPAYVMRASLSVEGYILLPSGVSADNFLGDADIPRFSDSTAEILRVESGIPAFENELEGNIPLEAGLYDVVSFEKGCYIGQEVVARVEQRGGGPSRRLLGFALSGEAEEGDAVLAGGSAVGEITSVVESPEYGHIALGYIDIETGSERDEIEIGSEGIKAEVRELPFEK
ncbi:MAG: glycine cleavage T C-terminal barrel domain-containing protein [Halobacteria archaeon]|nr:glycine cleavage T C-terminal barrel domain-containing protein [Halobacteria archaeon]